MKIAFITFEYPPDTADGGIATYVKQAVNMLQLRGNQVEVFAASRQRSGSETESNGAVIHRIKHENLRVDFAQPIAQVFARRHREIGFDVLEGPDYGADSRFAVQLVPDIPLVIKLHTPYALIAQFNKPSLRQTLRRKLNFYRRGISPFIDIERVHALAADEIASPSQAIGNKLIDLWKLDPNKVNVFPYPYIPAPESLTIPVDTLTNTVSFIGRLEIRKGVIDLAKAIPIILAKHPQTKFRFVGSTQKSPNPQQSMLEYLQELLQPYLKSIEFTGQIPPEQIPSALSVTDICVFPSIWESFGFVCLEGMSAGRGVVGSNSGGMAEIISSNEFGRLVPPESPQKIASAVIELLDDPKLRQQLGSAARARVMEQYNIDRIGSLQEESYRRAIARKKAKV
ncbi:glycosyltransferase family 4 protein [Synechocystis sp. PCC 7509]|uniref:glycosyltransferase family 4 protein n=1 Tax=Synechocystis sp. PCC 7509 TaxID=927677 RepID=UPI0002ABA5DA|nr:glycosyltransferase family 4 protein [Synechocystis sp. PCC 7509]